MVWYECVVWCGVGGGKLDHARIRTVTAAIGSLSVAAPQQQQQSEACEQQQQPCTSEQHPARLELQPDCSKGDATTHCETHIDTRTHTLRHPHCDRQ